MPQTKTAESGTGAAQAAGDTKALEGDSKAPSRLEVLCLEKGLRMTDQRRVILRVLSESTDHPDVETLHKRVAQLDSRIALATVYRTVALLEEANIIARHDFRNGRARYEEVTEEHHDHLVDVQTGEVIEFTNRDIEELQRRVAEELGYALVDHRLELYGVKLNAARTVRRRK